MLEARLRHLYSRISALGAASVAVAFSGGGDSTALLHALRDFPSVTHAFIIDHNLRSESAFETQQAAEFAKSLGYSVHVRQWGHAQPKTGLQVKARAYRYAAMGEMCRQMGVTHLLTAHTSDDQAETLLMRQDRGTGWRGLAGMRARAYAPLWPALADVTLVRPLLDVSRKELREYNQREGLSWIEDPSNENQDFTRVRARQTLMQNETLKVSLLNTQSENKHRLRSERKLFKDWISRYGDLNENGFFLLSRVPPSELLLHLLRIASGTGGPIDAARREALCESITSKGFKAATLAGAWVVKTKTGFLITRDKVAVQGRRGETAEPLQPITLKKGVPFIWDGRFKLVVQEDDIQVVPAYGQLQTLRQDTETQSLFDLPESVRLSCPVYMRGGKPIGFGAKGNALVHVETLAKERLSALWEIE